MVPQACLLIDLRKFPVREGVQENLGNGGMVGMALWI